MARLHYQITCLRDDVLHKLTTRLADCYGIVGIEDLNIKGLMKNRHLARSFSDAALGKLLQLLTSKVEARGGKAHQGGTLLSLDQILSWLWLEMGGDGVI